MASIRKRGPYQFEARIRRKGWPTQSKTFESKADAEAWAREVESEMDRGVFRSRAEAERTTLAECLERYLQEVTPHKKGRKAETNRIKQWLRHPLAMRPMAAIRGVDIAGYRDERLAAGKSAFSVNNDLIILSHLFTVARKDWGMESLINPVSLVRRPKLPRGRDRRISPQEEALLLEQADPQMQAIIIVALETGMRESEIAGMRRENIDIAGRFVRLLDTKNGEMRDVPLSSRALEAIGGLPVRMDGRVFSYVANTISHKFKTIADAAGLEDVRFHDTRHEATSRLFERGFNLMEVSAITGHKTLGVLKRYTHLKAADLAKRIG